MFSKRLQVTKSERHISRRKRFGTFSFRYYEGYRRSIFVKFYIGIWRAQTFFYLRICRLSWATLMSLRLLNKASVTPKQAHRTMHRLRCGKIYLMTASRIFGHLAVSCMRCAHWCLHSELKTCKDCIKLLLRGGTQGSLIILVRKWPQLSNSCYRSHQTFVHPQSKFWRYRLLRVCPKSSFLRRGISLKR